MNLTAIPLVTSTPCPGLEAVLAGALLGSIAVLAEALAEAPVSGGEPAPSVLSALVSQAGKAYAALGGGPGPAGPWTEGDGSPSPILCHYI